MTYQAGSVLGCRACGVRMLSAVSLEIRTFEQAEQAVVESAALADPLGYYVSKSASPVSRLAGAGAGQSEWNPRPRSCKISGGLTVLRNRMIDPSHASMDIIAILPSLPTCSRGINCDSLQTSVTHGWANIKDEF